MIPDHDSAGLHTPITLPLSEAVKKASRATAARGAGGEPPERTLGLGEDGEPDRNEAMPSAAAFVMASDTIAAIATPPGRGGIGIVRVSGPKAADIGAALLGSLPKPRRASLREFRDEAGRALDSGLVLFFVAPDSFTGEDVLELHGHGGAVVLDLVLKRVLDLGARQARPGEFSERAFLNDRLDLAQAEAIADLIDSGSEQAARAAMRSLSGEFSMRVTRLVESITVLRAYVEAAIDFPDEDVDFLTEGDVAGRLDLIRDDFEALTAAAHKGSLVREGLSVVID
jgi:tRNA modification GTPase